MSPALFIRVTFTASVYRGADLRRAEPLPSPARLHAAFVAAAAGGPDAVDDGGLLVATDKNARAVRWLEEHEPLGVVVPEAHVNVYRAVRHRVRAAVDPDSGAYHRDEDTFEPFSALDGSMTFVWPPAARDVFEALRDLAQEVTHVGRADSTVVVDVWRATST